jgi:hypothetical protein
LRQGGEVLMIDDVATTGDSILKAIEGMKSEYPEARVHRALRLRRLRKIAEETKNHDLESDLYIEERKAERGIYLRQRLVASGFFFYWCYGKILAHFAPKAGSLADQYDRAVRMLALGNTVPFVGPLTIDSEIKKFLFCSTNICPTPIIPPDGYQLAVLSQKSSSQSSSSFSSASRCAIISKSSEAI